MSGRKFLRWFALGMMNLDLDELVEAGVIASATKRGGQDWSRFEDQPLVFIAKADAEVSEALFSLLVHKFGEPPLSDEQNGGAS